jgi:hypothetical protein
MSNALKNAYLNIIMPYESYLAKHKPTLSATDNSTGSVAGVKREASSDSAMEISQGSLATPAASPPSHHDTPAPPARRSKRIKKEPTSYAGKHSSGRVGESGRLKNSQEAQIDDKLSISTNTVFDIHLRPFLDSTPTSPTTSQSNRLSSEPVPTKVADEAEANPKAICELCHEGGHLDRMLICDGCELGHHTFCLNPPLQHIPKTDWYCAKCLINGEDFGFEEGEEYSLSSFQQKCNTFKKEYFEKQGFVDGKAPEDAVEREFWRLVESTFETVEVEYGADLHSSQHGR